MGDGLSVPFIVSWSWTIPFQPKQKFHGAGDYGKAAVYKDDPEVFQKGKDKTLQHTKKEI